MKLKHYINGVPGHVQVAVSKWECVVDYVDDAGGRMSTVIMDDNSVASFAATKNLEVEVVDLSAPKPVAEKPAAKKPAAKKTAKE